MRKNKVEPDRSQMAVELVCFGCWICKGTDTHSEYGIRIAFPRQLVVTQMRMNVKLYVHCPVLLHYNIWILNSRREIYSINLKNILASIRPAWSVVNYFFVYVLAIYLMSIISFCTLLRSE